MNTNKIKVDCKSVIPIFKPNELAKIYYETDLMVENPWTVLRYNGNLVAVPSELIKGKSRLDITKHSCPFFKDGKCQLGDSLRPEFCHKELDESTDSISIINSLINNKYFKTIKATTPKDLKNLKEDSVLYYFAYIFQHINFDKLNLGIKLKPNYILIMENNKIKSVKEFNLITENENFKSLINTYNKLNRRFLYKDTIYQNTIVRRINNRLNGLSKTNINDKYLKESPIKDKDYVKELVKFATAILFITIASLSKNKQLKAYLKNIEENHKFLNYLGLYYLNEALTGQKDVLKEKDELSFRDLIPSSEPTKTVLKEITKLNDNILKVLLRR